MYAAAWTPRKLVASPPSTRKDWPVYVSTAAGPPQVENNPGGREQSRIVSNCGVETCSAYRKEYAMHLCAPNSLPR